MGQTTQPEPERTFHFFSRLPAELRWKIWEYNLPTSRLVSIRCGADDLGGPPSAAPSTDNNPARYHRHRHRPASPRPGCTSPARIPTNLHACHESRREALRHYRPSFGLARRPGHIFFAPSGRDADVLYFGPRDGFMAAEAQLRTVLTLCDPTELAAIERVAVNDAVFWPAGGVGAAMPPPPPLLLAAYSSNGAGRGGFQQGGGGGGGEQQQRMLASSLLVDVLHLMRARLPGLRELVFVPRDENPLYSGDACLVEPTMAQSRLAHVVHEAMGVVFPLGAAGGAAAERQRRWDWKIMTLGADAEVPVNGRHVLGWETVPALSARDNGGNMEFGNAHGPGHTGRGFSFSAGGRSIRRGDKREWAAADRGKGREFAQMNVLQESVRRQFMQMEMGVAAATHAVPVLVE